MVGAPGISPTALSFLIMCCTKEGNARLAYDLKSGFVSQAQNAESSKTREEFAQLH